ncbi:hypothetical protein GJ744_005972 [Endocarpon pusillum]|uniref:Uncharacterized protein n=1 Tax=Endocarpon pusillum TaxID=364733 RepID=A0A8H7A4B2_9EURO|nr:hypothetical protein GJ744_005972 [Endocarpon pusillum]
MPPIPSLTVLTILTTDGKRLERRQRADKVEPQYTSLAIAADLQLPQIPPRPPINIIRPPSSLQPLPDRPGRRRAATDIPVRPHRGIVRARFHPSQRQIDQGAWRMRMRMRMRMLVLRRRRHLHHARQPADLILARRYARRVCLEDAHGGAVGFAAATEDGVAAGGLDGGDDAGGRGGAADVDQLPAQVGRDAVDARESV